MRKIELTTLVQALASAGLLTVGLGAAAQSAEAPKKEGVSMQEIVVTAQKVAQPASKTPLALTVLGGEDLKEAGIVEARALGDAVPNVQIGQESGKLQIAIRGVISLDMTEKGDPSAAFNIDGAYIGRPEAQTGAFYDIDRIEVLRGPQGTLYGRNATAGAINLITNKPTRVFGGRVGVELGNYNTVRADAALNVPLTEMLALRAAVNLNQHSTYFNPGPNTDIPLDSQDDRSGRVHLLAQFSKQTSLLLTAETSHIGGGGATPVPMSNFFNGTLIDNLPFSPPGTGNNIQNPVYVDRGSDAQRTAGLRFNATNAHRSNRANSERAEFKTTFGGVDLTYQLARVRTQIDELQNGVYFGFPFQGDVNGPSSSTSHELRFNNADPNSALRWVAGLYSFNEDIHRDTQYRTYISAPFGSFTVLVPFNIDVNNKSKAVFGQATYSLRPDTRVTAGLRGTRDEKTGSDTLGGTPATPPATSSPDAYAKSVKFSNTSWKLGLEHDLRPNVLLYASAATGYKAGGFNDRDIAGEYKPENLRAIEAGLKGRFFDQALLLTANVFHYDYKDLQLNSVVCLTPGDPTSCGSITTNAANAKINGAELEAKLSIGENGLLRGSLALNDAKFETYKPNATDDWSGQRLDRAPRSTLNLGYTHRFPLASGAEVSATVGTRLSSAYFISDPAAGIRYQQPSFHKSDVSIGYTDAQGKLSLQLFVKNIEDEITIESRVPGSFFIGDPRTFGVRVNYNF